MGFEDKIRSKINRAFRESVEEAAYEVAFDIESEYEKVIDKFYADYSPNYYRRTYQTYNASDYYANDTKVTKIGDECLVGIRLNSDRIERSYSESSDKVFTRTFEYGIHGSEDIKIMENPPKEIMDEWFSKYCSSTRFNEVFRDAFSKKMA